MSASGTLLDRIWRRLLDRFGGRRVRRVSALIDVFTGCREARPLDRRQQVFPRLYFPGLTAQPWHNSGLLNPLRRAFEGIRGEYLHLVRKKTRFVPYEPGYRSGKGGSTGRDDWTAFYFHRAFRKNTQNLKRCPAVRAALSRLRVGRESFYSVLEPGGRITPHSDRANFLLTAHLGLVIPSPCGIRVGGEERAWEEGRWLLFDASFVHEAWNASGAPRAVFVADLWHPELTDAEVSALRSLWPAFERGMSVSATRPRAIGSSLA